MIGIGTDLVDIARLRRSLERTPGLVDRLFRPGEMDYAQLRSDPAERYAGRFAAKEATLKAMGLGLGGAALRDIEVARAGNGAPSLVLHASALAAATERGISEWLVTITHTDQLAHAIVVAL
jgi:holo-[acyl-carrier protein] synthase